MTMESLSIYLPQDRLRALARGETIPDRTSGAALFADISGFTALTEALRESLGSRRGGEELSKHLSMVYSALIAEVERFGGSVINFAGDAITCWFDDANDPAAPRAMGSAFALQMAMKSFSAISLPNGATTALTLKVAVATGPARRFMVGDPTVHYMDALAGATVARTATAERLATKGEVLVDEATVKMLGAALTIQAWREDTEAQERFAVVANFASEAKATALPATARPPDANKLRVWLHGAVYEREQAGQESFLTEFRPCAVLFVRFEGIDYDADVAEKQLDSFLRQVQQIAEQYEGAVLQLTIGDKGSYLYANFGALTSHEDDARRAVKAALEIKNKSDLHLQMGIAQGVMRVGAYGGQTRQTYGALGDVVNLAARLMTSAAAGEILVSGPVHNATARTFLFEPRAALSLKGKTEPVAAFALISEQQHRAIRLQEPNYALPMVGRVQELEIIKAKLGLVLQGKSQVIGIIAEAGIGKSRLVAEVIRSARKKGFVGFGGACQSDTVNTPYQAWKSIWQAFFEVDHEMPLKRQMHLLKGNIEDHAPERVQAMPLLNIVLDLQIPDNDFTQMLEPKYRRSALHALLEDCLKTAGKDEPLLIVIEDLHWMDALSIDLLEELVRALGDSRVCFVLAYRPSQSVRLEAPRLEALPNFTRIELHELDTAEAEQAIRAKLVQLYPARSGTLPIGLVDKLMARAQGNPFYLEELLNYVRDRGLDPADLNSIELPDSLHTLILSRIDQLSEHEKTTLRVASIVGRLFRAQWLTGYYPELGEMAQVHTNLAQLTEMDITSLDTPEPELAYLFKHIVTHEVTYESLPFATRAKLHEQLARYLETMGATTAPPLDTIAFHYGRSDNQAKQMEYLRKAGEAAQKNYANNTALNYYGSLLLLLKDPAEKVQIHLKRGQVVELLGNYVEAESAYLAALASAQDNLTLKAQVQFALAKLNRLRGDYTSALAWLEQAQTAHTLLKDTAGLARGLIETGAILGRKGEYVQACESLNKGLVLARAVDDRLSAALALNNLGVVVSLQGDYAAARALHEESLSLRREKGDKHGISMSLNNLGVVAYDQGEYSAARTLLEESLTLKREMGDKLGIAASLNNLGIVASSQGDNATARLLYEESLNLRREMGDKWGIATSLNNLGNVTYSQGDYVTARTLLEESLALCKEMDEKTSMAYSLFNLGLVNLAEGKPVAREHILHSLRLRAEMGEQLPQTSCLVGVAGLVLQEGNPRFAAQLLGGVTSVLTALKGAMETEARHIYLQTLTKVKEALGEEPFNAAWAEGGKWTLEEAVALALQEEK